MSFVIQRFAQHCKFVCCCPKSVTRGQNGKRSMSFLSYKWDASDWADLPNKIRFWYNASSEEIINFLDQRELAKIQKDQQFRLNRFNMLGPDLAAATFIVYRGGKVKFEHIPRWTSKTSSKKDSIPNKRDDTYKLEGIDASGMPLLGIAFDNLKDLKSLRYLRLSKIFPLNDWYLARLQRFAPTLEFLDVSNNLGITDEGLAALHKLRKLKCLNITECKNVRNAEVVIAYLTELNPELTVLGADTLPKPEGSLQDREHKYRRFLSLGEAFNVSESKTISSLEEGKKEIDENQSEKTDVAVKDSYLQSQVLKETSQSSQSVANVEHMKM